MLAHRRPSSAAGDYRIPPPRLLPARAHSRTKADDSLEQTQAIIEALQDVSENPVSIEDDGVFESIVDKVIMGKYGSIIFRLINGLELGGFHG